MRLAAVLLSLAFAGAAQAQTAQSPPPPAGAGLTKAQAEAGFYLDVARCLYSREHAADIAALPPEAMADLRPAAPAERLLFKDPKIKVWTTNALGPAVLLAERAPDRCDVVAMQIPVETTFQMVLERLHQSDPELRPVDVKPGYNPIVYQLERVVDGYRYVVHLEGSEPGGPGHPSLLTGHAFKYSLLNAWIVRQPEGAKPFR